MEEKDLSTQESAQSEVEFAEESANTEAAEETAEAAGTGVDRPSADDAETGESKETGAAGNSEEIEREPFHRIHVKFNKQEREYTPEEAAPLVEMGLKWDSFKGSHDKLKFLAMAQEKSVSELIDSLIDSHEETLYQQTLAECGGNEAVANKLFDMQKSERQRHFADTKMREQEQVEQEELSEQEQLQKRLSEDYQLLSKEMPGKFTQFTELPASVVETAVKEGIPLFDAVLRFEYRETKNREAAKVIQAEAARRSAGSMSGEANAPEPDLDSFEKAFHYALR